MDRAPGLPRRTAFGWCRRSAGPRPRCSPRVRSGWTGPRTAGRWPTTDLCSGTVGPGGLPWVTVQTGPRTDWRLTLHPELVGGRRRARAGLLGPDRRRGHPRPPGHRPPVASWRGSAPRCPGSCTTPSCIICPRVAWSSTPAAPGAPATSARARWPCCSPSARTRSCGTWFDDHGRPERTRGLAAGVRLPGPAPAAGPAGRARRRRLLAAACPRPVPGGDRGRVDPGGGGRPRTGGP